MYSENEVKELLTPVKKLNSPSESYSKDLDKNLNQNNSKHSQHSNEDSNSSQNDWIYGGGNNISYGTKSVNQNKGGDLTPISKPNSYKQFQNPINLMNNNKG